MASYEEAACFFNTLGDITTVDSCASKAASVRIVRQELSCTLCWGNARMNDRSPVSVARSVERVFMPGLKRAVNEARDVEFRPFRGQRPVV